MKRVGYRPEEAGGIEAAASTGGQVLPPLLGAGAFLIAEYTGFAYVEVVKAALIPALLYMATIYLFVHLVAARRGIEGLPASRLPSVPRVLASGWHYLVAIVVLVGALLLDLSVTRVGFLACVAVALLAAARAGWDRWRTADPVAEPSSLTGEARTAASRLVAAFVIAGRNAVPVSLACAVAGIIVGVVGLTGLGLKFSAIMLALSQGNLLLALGLVMVASLVLGMGLPVTASYVVLIVLAGPALVTDFGLPVLVAHLVVFWYSQDSNVTPPVCLAAYAAAGIAGSDPMRTGLHAWKYAKGLYLIPLFMVVHPEIVLGGDPGIVALKAAAAMAGLTAFAAALEGYLAGRVGWGARIVLLLTLGLSFHPSAWVAAGAIPVLGIVALWTRNGTASAVRVAGP
jgi:TRAP transporter 4TM/12TM fusion protein